MKKKTKKTVQTGESDIVLHGATRLVQVGDNRISYNMPKGMWSAFDSLVSVFGTVKAHIAKFYLAMFTAWYKANIQLKDWVKDAPAASHVDTFNKVILPCMAKASGLETGSLRTYFSLARKEAGLPQNAQAVANADTSPEAKRRAAKKRRESAEAKRLAEAEASGEDTLNVDGSGRVVVDPKSENWQQQLAAAMQACMAVYKTNVVQAVVDAVFHTATAHKNKKAA